MAIMDRSVRHEGVAEVVEVKQSPLLWHLGMFFVIFGLFAFVIVGNQVYATLNSQFPLSYIFSSGYEAEEHEAQESLDIYWKDYRIAAGQSLSSIFEHMGIEISVLRKIMQSHPLAKRLDRIQPGKTIKFRYVDDEFAGLEYVTGPARSLLVLRKGDGFVVSEVKQDYEKFTRYATGTIESSLFQSAKSVGLSEKITAEMARIFGWDIDFALDIQPGDKFSVVYQSLYHNGQKIGDGDILAAEFVTEGKTYRAVRYTTPDGRTGYYSPDGNNMHKPFLRTPVHFSRISSRFGHRKHPVLNTMRLHKGVDYAAPRGTVVKASGKGKIIFRGSLRGYGKTVIIQHGKRYRTLYAHLQGYESAQRMGSYVEQGDPIGYVGSSGLATGPHLHYEFLVNGVHRNPLEVKLPEAMQLTDANLQDFKNRASSMLNMLDMVSQSTLAMNVSGETRLL